MNDKLIYLLSEGASEIQSLRRQNELLLAKVEVMDLFACALNTSPRHPTGIMREDIAWRLDAEAGRLTAASCTHRQVTVTEGGGGRCNICGVHLEYDGDSRNWVVAAASERAET